MTFGNRCGPCVLIDSIFRLACLYSCLDEFIILFYQTKGLCYALSSPIFSLLDLVQLYSTDNANQREKHEANLKTEIKKLQRFRDQIKTWHASNDIKDKTALADARRDIERRMEKFKVCEKEAKTKAFSKEGLQAAASRQDPKEKAKQEMRDWLNNTVDHLNTQIEEFEAEVEDIGSSSGKKKGKAPPRVTHLEESIVRHKQHITRLEQMLRLFDNDEISTDDVEGIKDLVDDYLDRNQDDPEEFDSPDDLYADVLEQLEAMSEAVVAAPPSHSKSAKDREAQKERDREERERERQKAAALAAKAQLAAQGNTRLMTETEDDKKLPTTPAAVKPISPTPAVAALPAASIAAASTSAGAGAVVVGGAAAPPPPPPPPPRGPGSKDSPALGPPTSGPGTPMRGQGVGTPTASPLTPSSGTTPAPAATLTAGQPDGFPALGAGNGVKQAPVGPAAAPGAAAAAVAAAAVAEDTNSVVGLDAGAMDGGLDQLAAQLGAMGIQDGTAGLTPAQCLQLMQAAAPRSIPQHGDAQWQQLPLRPRPPPVAPPPSYPTSRLPVFDNPALFDKLDQETLFLAFYEQPGSYQQYLAARSLKQQAWRFHKQHQAWFQRREEPKAGGQPGDDWEEGRYIYFDHLLRESEAGGPPAGWCYRLKSDFLFKYNALEDELNI